MVKDERTDRQKALGRVEELLGEAVFEATRGTYALSHEHPAVLYLQQQLKARDPAADEEDNAMAALQGLGPIIVAIMNTATSERRPADFYICEKPRMQMPPFDELDSYGIMPHGQECIEVYVESEGNIRFRVPAKDDLGVKIATLYEEKVGKKDSVTIKAQDRLEDLKP